MSEGNLILAVSALERVNEMIVSRSGEILLGATIVGLALLAIFRRWVWRELAALQTAQILMIFLIPLLFAVVLLPQNGNYEDLARFVRWEWPVNLAKGLRLMDVWVSTPFYAVITLLAISAAVCSLHNLASLLRRRGPAAPKREEVVDAAGAAQLRLGKTFSPAGLNAVYNALQDRGLRGPRIQAEAPPEAVTFESGSGTLWPAALYHLGLVLLAVGILTTWLFGFSGYVAVFTDQPQAVALRSKATRWNALCPIKLTAREKTPSPAAGKEAPALNGTRSGPAAPAAPSSAAKPDEKAEDVLWLGLEKLRVVHKQWPRLAQYPSFGHPTPKGHAVELAVERFRSAWTSGAPALKGAVSEQDLGVPSVSAAIVSYLVDAEKLRHLLKPGRVIKTEGLDIGLLTSEYKVDIEVEGAPPLRKLSRGTSFKPAPSSAEYVIDYITAGALTALDRKETVLTPTVYLTALPAPPPAGAKPTAVETKPTTIVLPLNQTRQVGGKKVRVTAVTEGCLLHYRHDPGQLVWGAAAIIILFALSVRVYWPHYRVKTFAEKSSAGTITLHVSVDAHGVFADAGRAMQTVEKALAAQKT